jgi:WD40 repeat protein
LLAPNSGLLKSNGRVFASFANDGKKIATGGFDTPTIVWETDTAKQLLRMNGRTNMAYKVAFSADGNQLYFGRPHALGFADGRGLRLRANPSDQQFAFPSPDGRLLASFSPTGSSVTIFETPSGRKLQTFTPPGDEVVQRASFSPDGTMLVVNYTESEAQMKQAELPDREATKS